MRGVLAIFLLLLSLVAVTVSLIVFGIRLGLEVQAKKSWPSINGVVLESRVTGATNKSQAIFVRYRYEVAGTVHEGADNVRDTGPRRVIPSAYHVDQPINVLYNSTAANKSALQPGDHGPTIFLIVFGTVGTLLISPFMVYFGLLVYAHILMIKARYHLRQGMKALTEGAHEANLHRDAQGRLPTDLAQRESEVIEQGAAALELLREMEEQLNGPSATSERNAESSVTIDVPVANPIPFWGYGWFWKLMMCIVAIYGALWWIALAWWPALTLYLCGALVLLAFVVPIGSGIWLGQSLVARGRRRLANQIGWGLIVMGALAFGWFASRNKDGYWDTVPYGHIIGPTGTTLGLIALFFGLGMALRQWEKGDGD